jgi:calreticulin
MLAKTLVLCLVCAANAEVFFEEKFDDASWTDRWTPSEWKSDAGLGEFKHTAGEWFVDEAADMGIQTTTDMKNHAISAALPKSFSNRDKDLVVQFSVKNEKREYSFCGGGYIKLLPKMDAKAFGGDTPYSIMFGPDMCGYDVSRIHLIFTDASGKNLLKTDEIKLDYADKNEFTHIYTLILKPDNSYEVLFDGASKAAGSIIDGWDFEKETHDDPSDSKPGDWVDDKEIDDPEDKKPEGYDDVPKQIADPDAAKPDDWSDEDDGEWEAPMIDNAEFKGEFVAKRIENPAYKGEWKAKQITNDKFKADVYAFDDISHVGFELWTVNNGTIFDNIIITDSAEEAKTFAEGSKKTQDGEKAAKEAYDKANAPEPAAEEAKEESKEESKEEL